MRRRWIVLVVGLLLGGIAAARYSCREQAPRVGHVSEYQALDDGTAIVVWHQFEDRGESWSVLRLDDTGKLRWRRTIEAYGQRIRFAVSDDVVVVRSFAEYCDRPNNIGQLCDNLVALDLDTGRVLWTRKETLRRGQAASELRRPLIIGNRFIDDFVDAGDKPARARALFAIDTRTGDVAWETPLPDVLGDPVVLGDPRWIGKRLLLHDGFSAVVTIDTETGMTTRTPMDVHTQIGIGCVADGAYFAITKPYDNPTLTAFAGGDLSSPRDIVGLPRVADKPLYSPARSCWTYGDRLVFLIEMRSNPAPGLALVALVVGRDGSNPRLIEIARASGFTALPYVSGTVSRFLPMRVSRDAVCTIDLEAATTKCGSPRDQFGLYSRGSRWYLHRDGSGERSFSLATFDGDSGELRAAHVEIWALDFDEQHVAGGKIWLLQHGASQHVAIDALPMVVLDAATLAPTFVRGSRVTDAKEIVRQRFGI